MVEMRKSFGRTGKLRDAFGHAAAEPSDEARVASEGDFATPPASSVSGLADDGEDRADRFEACLVTADAPIIAQSVDRLRQA